MVDEKVKNQKSKIKSTAQKVKVEKVKPELKIKALKTPVAEKKAEVKLEAPKAVKKGGVEISVLDISGKPAGKITLPSVIFEAKINPELMAQAIRVYQFAQRRGTASTKTRGEVNGTTKKVYRQKGTGRARHGAAKAPIFVGGGITFGPKPREFNLSIPKKMRRGSLFSALSSKLLDKKIMVLNADGVTGKTSEMSKFLKNANIVPKKVTIVVDSSIPLAVRAAKNLEGVTVIRAEDLHTYLVLNSNTIVIAKSSIDVLTKTFVEKTTN